MVVPDVARGLALFGIAMANLPTAWVPDANDGAPGDYFGGVLDDSLWDKAAVIFEAMFVHVRGLPMFSTLLGFGIGLITMSLWRRQFPLKRTRAVLIRRYGFLAFFGVLHGIFLFTGDIMMLYGISGVIIALMVPLRDKTLHIIAGVMLGIGAGIGAIGSLFFLLWQPSAPAPAGAGIDAGSGMDMLPADTFGRFIAENAGEVAAEFFLYVLVAFPFFPLMLIGFTWARRGVLAHVEQHRRELGIWAAVLAAIVLVIGLPWGLAALDVVPQEYEDGLFFLNMFFGPLTGPGILAALALLLDAVQKRTERGAPLPGWLYPFAALGKRSMSGYLCQSIILFVLVYPFTLHLGHEWSAATQMLVAFGIWLVTVILACVLEAAGKPGPFEWVHRRLSYGRTGRAQLDPKARK